MNFLSFSQDISTSQSILNDISLQNQESPSMSTKIKKFNCFNEIPKTPEYFQDSQLPSFYSQPQTPQQPQQINLENILTTIRKEKQIDLLYYTKMVLQYIESEQFNFDSFLSHLKFLQLYCGLNIIIKIVQRVQLIQNLEQSQLQLLYNQILQQFFNSNIKISIIKLWIEKYQQIYANPQSIPLIMQFLLQNSQQSQFKLNQNLLTPNNLNKVNIEYLNKITQCLIQNSSLQTSLTLQFSNFQKLNKEFWMQNRQNFQNLNREFSDPKSQKSLIYLINNNILINYNQKGNFYTLFQSQIDFLSTFTNSQEILIFAQKIKNQLNFKSDFMVKLMLKLYFLTNNLKFLLFSYKFASNKQKGQIFVLICESLCESHKNINLVNKLIKVNRFDTTDIILQLERIKYQNLYFEDKTCVTLHFLRIKNQLVRNIRNPLLYVDLGFWFLNPLGAFFNPFLALVCVHNAITLQNNNIQAYRLYIRIQLLNVINKKYILTFQDLIKLFRSCISNINRSDKLFDSEADQLDIILQNQTVQGSPFISDSYLSYILLEEYEKIIQLQKMYEKAIEWQKLQNNNEQLLSNFINNKTWQIIEEKQQKYMKWLSVSKRFVQEMYQLFQ